MAVGRKNELQDRQRGRIGPLQVVEEEHQRRFFAGAGFHEASKRALEAGLRLVRWQRGDLRLLAEGDHQLGNHVDDDASIVTERQAQPPPPVFELARARGEVDPHELTACVG